MIRTFIAIDLSTAARQGIERIGKELQKTDAPVGWVKPERIHLTLKFLGDVTDEQIKDIKAALEKVAAKTSAFRLQPLGCGAFPTIKQMRVVWVGVHCGDESLPGLQKEVEKAMAELGFKPEDRPFRAHLTLGRVRGRQNMRALQDALLANQTFEAEAFDVTELVLYKSELRREGALYTPLFRAAFGQGK